MSLSNTEQTFVVLAHECSTCNLALIDQALLEKKMCSCNDYKHVYSPGQGQTTPVGKNVCTSINLLSVVSLFHLMTF